MEDLKLLLERRYDCKATLLEQRLAQTKKYDDGTRVKREVFTYRLEGHPTAKRAFIWQKESSFAEKEIEYTSMLAEPPVSSPETALEEALARVMKDLYNL